jgi:hypothetical protein
MSRRRSNPTLTAALCTSLTAHGLALSAVAWWFVRHAPPPWAAPFTHADLDRVVLPEPVLPPVHPRPKRRPPQLPIPAEDDQPFKDDSGEHGGHGTANRSTPGAKPMLANRAADQADLMHARLDDPSLIDPTAANAAQSGQVARDDAAPLSTDPAQRGAYHPDFVAQATPAPTAAGEAAPRPSRKVGPLPPTPALAVPAEDDDAPPVVSGTRDATARASPAVAPPPAARQAAGRVAAPSDTDSQAFSADADHTFEPGRVDARNGMKVQLVDPVFGEASRTDLWALGGLHAAYGLRIRPDGTVADVQVVRSSGSANVDEDCKRALWLGVCEPDKDKAGHPVATVWVIRYD